MVIRAPASRRAQHGGVDRIGGAQLQRIALLREQQNVARHLHLRMRADARHAHDDQAQA